MLLNDRNGVDVIYIDFSKAFDSVVHSKLLLKLESYGISGNLCAWIKSFLTDRTQSVKVGDHLSEPSDVVSGVPQGSVLGPLVFINFINDIVDIFGSGLSVKLYADDVKLYLVIDDVECSQTLQQGLIELGKWCADWQLSLSLDKCFTLQLGRTLTRPLKLLNSQPYTTNCRSSK